MGRWLVVTLVLGCGGGESGDGDVDTDTDTDTDTDADCSVTCPGCCDGQECMAGDSDDQCGSGGEACADCADGEECEEGVCVNRACMDACDGCCSGETCLDGNVDEACGTDGSPCTQCESFEDCVVGECSLDLDVDWDFTLVDGEIAPQNEGRSWDLAGGPPDPFCELDHESFPKVYATEVVENSFDPVWNESRQAAGSAWIGQLDVSCWDQDPGENALIGTCSFEITEEHLENRGFSTPCGQAQALNFTLAPL